MDAIALEAHFATVRADPESAIYLDVVRQTPLLRQLREQRLAIEWTTVRLVRDDPAKTLDTTGRTDELLLTNLLEIIGRPETAFDLVSPYFVPGQQGTAVLTRLARRGVKVRVLTNSLAATDVPYVHAGYAKRRCDLLRAGVQLYELKPIGEVVGRKAPSPGSGSPIQLHAKTSEFDHNRVFVGSFNFDPRSALLNTEMGLVIESPELAQRLSSAFDVQIPQVAYEVREGAGDRCPEWIERTPAGEIHYDSEPGAGMSQRVFIQFLQVLPIDWLL
jgi:putative cardiolipin synthase